jgi:lipopolysaccharide/colanic/teichoic acid biosynthesis glycosyltransferase
VEGLRHRDAYPGKRLLDLVIAAVGLVVLSPVLLATGVMIRLTSHGPALHRARRIGRDGVPFELLKFRSMAVDAATSGPGITARGDARITAVGRVIRSTKLDELPQMVNVLRGDMSIVGPRPEDPRYVERYTDAQREILRWRPGLTSPASLTYRDEESVLAGAENLDAAYELVMADKIAIDLAYFRTQSLLGDLAMLAKTARAVVRKNPS